jgi:hypothetical protein
VGEQISVCLCVVNVCGGVSERERERERERDLKYDTDLFLCPYLKKLNTETSVP